MFSVLFRTPRRPRFIAEVALVALGYGLYALIRNAVPDVETEAIARSLSIWKFEQGLRIDFELWLNHTLHAADWLTVTANYFYATMHFIVTIPVVAWPCRPHSAR